MKCPEKTRTGKPCSNPLARSGPDPDGISRCVHHSRDPKNREIHKLKGLFGRMPHRARALLEQIEQTGEMAAPVVATAPSDPSIDLSSPESIRKTLEAALRDAKGKVPPAEYVKLANGAARALRGADGKHKGNDAPTTPREIRHVVVRSKEEAAVVEAEQKRADDIEAGILDDEDEEPRAVAH